ncbi:MAG: hypothetical protein NZZ41_07310 [Candidatus Dojkabacteria bacterium]|nr:hypothetical protein [Candidatus Dojkabacteria bacterium]
MISKKEITLTNLDFHIILPKITSKSFQVMKYADLNKNKLKYYNIILYNYPGNVGHWTLFCFDKGRMYFFDPYGNAPDSQWSFLQNPEQKSPPEFKLSQFIKECVEKNYSFNRNSYNIQGSIRNGHIVDSACGEIIILRILYNDLDDFEFYKMCLKLGGKKIFNLIKNLK